MATELPPIAEGLAEGLRTYSDIVVQIRALTKGKPKLARIYDLVRLTPELEEYLNTLTAYDNGNYDYGQYYGCGC